MTKNKVEIQNELNQLAEMVQNNLNSVDETCEQTVDTELFPEEELNSYAALIESYHHASTILRKTWSVENHFFDAFFDKLPVYISYLNNYIAKKDQRSLYKLQVIYKSIQSAFQKIPI